MKSKRAVWSAATAAVRLKALAVPITAHKSNARAHAEVATANALSLTAAVAADQTARLDFMLAVVAESYCSKLVVAS
jgi:hypothetical protein